MTLIRTYRIYLFALLSVFVLNACEEPIELDLEQGEAVVVIDGWVTDAPGPYDIKITQSVTFTSELAPPPVSGAVVTLSDDAGFSEQLFEAEPGIYRTTNAQGEIGRTYNLRVDVAGQTYEAESYLPRINDIDTLIVIEEDSSYILGEGKYILMVAQEAPGVGDFYQFRFFKNDSLYDGLFDYFFSDDRFVDGQLAMFQYPYKVESEDTIIVEVRSITVEAYDFLFTMLQQAGGGGPFGAPPANLVGNISNEGLGFFGTAGVVRDTIVVP